MSIELNEIKCPSCGAKLSIEDDRDSFFCSYCGAKVITTYENEQVYRHIDEAEVRKTEAEKNIKLKELELEEKEEERNRKDNEKNRPRRLKIAAILGALGLVIFILGLVLGEFIDGGGLLSSVGLLLLIPAVLAIFLSL